MAVKLSTGLVKAMMDTAPFKTIFAVGFIDIYSGGQPATADDVPTGTKLVTLYSNGTSVGISFDTAAPGGALPKAPGETWSGTVIAPGGTAGWFRLRGAPADVGGFSTTLARYDGAISTSGAQMNLGSLVLITGAPFIIDSAVFTLPAA